MILDPYHYFMSPQSRAIFVLREGFIITVMRDPRPPKGVSTIP